MINRSLFAFLVSLCLLLPAKGQIKADYELPSIPAGKYLERLRAFTTQEFKRVDLVRLKPQGTAEDPEWNTILDENGKVDKQRIESRVPITGETLTEIFKVLLIVVMKRKKTCATTLAMASSFLMPQANIWALLNSALSAPICTTAHLCLCIKPRIMMGSRSC